MRKQMAGKARSVCFILTLALCLPLLAGAALAAEKVRFGTPVKATANHDLPFLAAEEKGYWRQNDLDVQWISFDGGAFQVRALAAGGVDVVMTVAISYIPAAARGVPAIMVADLGLRNDIFLWVRADSPIKEAKDLKGAKVGVPALGAFAHFIGIMAAKALGMEKEVKFVGAGGAAASIAGLKAGSIDGVILDFFVMTPLRFKGEVRPALIMRDFLSKEWVDYTIVARSDFIERSPAAMRRTVKAFLQAGAFIMDNPDWTMAKLKASYGYPEDTARAVYEALKFSGDGKIVPKGLENVRTFIIDYGIVPKDKVPPIEKLFTTKFVE